MGVKRVEGPKQGRKIFFQSNKLTKIFQILLNLDILNPIK